MSQPLPIEPENERRLRLLFERAVRRTTEVGQEGGEVLVRIRVEKGGRVSRTSKVTTDEYPLTPAGEEPQTLLNIP